MLERAQQEPVTIEKNGRPVAVVMSFDEYQRLEALEDEAWGRWAVKAEQEGFIGSKASEKIVEDLLNAQD